MPSTIAGQPGAAHARVRDDRDVGARRRAVGVEERGQVRAAVLLLALEDADHVRPAGGRCVAGRRSIARDVAEQRALVVAGAATDEVVAVRATGANGGVRQACSGSAGWTS